MGLGVKGFMGLWVCGFMDSWVLEFKMGMLTPGMKNQMEHHTKNEHGDWDSMGWGSGFRTHGWGSWTSSFGSKPSCDQDAEFGA